MQDPKSLNVSLIEVWKFGNYTWSFELRRIQITGTFNREASVEPNAEQLTTYASTQDRRVQSQPKLESLCADRSEAAQLATCTWDKIWQSLWNCIVSAVSPHWTARLFGCGVQNRLKSWERLMNKPEYFAGSTAPVFKSCTLCSWTCKAWNNLVQAASADPNVEFCSILSVSSPWWSWQKCIEWDHGVSQNFVRSLF